MKLCVAPNCKKNNHNRGKYCGMHAARLYRNGSLDLNKISDKERFLSKIIKNNDCWIWQGHLHHGYGRFSIKCKSYIASRAAYILFKGKIPDKLYVCHSCDNPACVNPEHLWLGTDKDNAQDSVIKGRNYYKKGENHPKAILKNEQVIIIKNKLKNKETITKISKEMNIAFETVKSIKKGKIWKHIQPNL